MSAVYYSEEAEQMLLYVLYHPELNVLVLSSCDTWPGLEYIGEL